MSEWPGWVEPRVALLSELAVLIAGRGDRDPVISVVAVSGKWEPARRVETLIDSVLTPPRPQKAILHAEDEKFEAEATAKLPNANDLLHRLTVAVVRDEVERARQIRDRAAAELVAIRPDERLAAVETRAAKAELQASRAIAESARAKKSEELLLAQVGSLCADLRFFAENAGQDPETYVAAVLNSDQGETPAEQEPQERELPKGIRQRGERFEALIYRAEAIDRRQRSAGTHGIIEEAVAAREAALERETIGEAVQPDSGEPLPNVQEHSVDGALT